MKFFRKENLYICISERNDNGVYEGIAVYCDKKVSSLLEFKEIFWSSKEESLLEYVKRLYIADRITFSEENIWIISPIPLEDFFHLDFLLPRFPKKDLKKILWGELEKRIPQNIVHRAMWSVLGQFTYKDNREHFCIALVKEKKLKQIQENFSLDNVFLDGFSNGISAAINCLYHFKKEKRTHLAILVDEDDWLLIAMEESVPIAVFKLKNGLEKYSKEHLLSEFEKIKDLLEYRYPQFHYALLIVYGNHPYLRSFFSDLRRIFEVEIEPIEAFGWGKNKWLITHRHLIKKMILLDFIFHRSNKLFLIQPSKWKLPLIPKTYQSILFYGLILLICLLGVFFAEDIRKNRKIDSLCENIVSNLQAYHLIEASDSLMIQSLSLKDKANHLDQLIESYQKMAHFSLDVPSLSDAIAWIEAQPVLLQYADKIDVEELHYFLEKYPAKNSFTHSFVAAIELKLHCENKEIISEVETSFKGDSLFINHQMPFIFEFADGQIRCQFYLRKKVCF